MSIHFCSSRCRDKMRWNNRPFTGSGYPWMPKIQSRRFFPNPSPILISPHSPILGGYRRQVRPVTTGRILAQQEDRSTGSGLYDRKWTVWQEVNCIRAGSGLHLIASERGLYWYRMWTAFLRYSVLGSVSGVCVCVWTSRGRFSDPILWQASLRVQCKLEY